ncbi:hypothetical protein GGQ87_002872 [Brevundimonas alba]|uniref:Uncharacterized protein n=1 Tax=Brevundimonas alba TaxID=74314 RepID=A0A7X6BPL6_9CAUL|nr:hypothetical protein [Brevundimonas alba]
MEIIRGVPEMAVSIALAVSKRLQPIAAAFLCLMAAQLAVASCTPDPAPYAVRVGVFR